MSKRAVLIHGWEGTPEHGWHPWLRDKLTKKGWEVAAPAMPDTNTPTMEKWVEHLSKTVGNPDENTYLVGHSLGCITILRYLETLEESQKIGGVILVAGFSYDLEYSGYKRELSSFFQTPVDFDKVKKHCDKFVVLHSTDDAWVPVKHASVFEEKLGAKTIIQTGMKHYSGDDGISELPVVLEELLRISTSKQN